MTVSLKQIMLGRALHSLLSGLVLQIAGSLLGAIGGGLWSITAWIHIALGSVGVYLSAYVVRQTPTWLAWLAQFLGGAPPTAAAGLLLALLVLPLAHCSAPPADASTIALVRGPVGLTGTIAAAGDSLGPYTFKFGAPVSGASAYVWTLTASRSNGTWGNLPTNQSTAVDSIVFTVASTSAGVWDSVTFTLTGKPTSAIRSAKSAATASWTVYRYLIAPTSLTGDSSRLGPMSLLDRSPTQDSLMARGGVYAHVAPGAAVQFCTFVRFGSGHLASVTPAAACGSVATANFAPARLAGFTAAESSWLAGGCSPWRACLLGLRLAPAPTDALRLRIA